MTAADEKIGLLEDELCRVKEELFRKQVAERVPYHRAIHLIRRLLEETEALPGGEAAIREALRKRGDILLPDEAREVMRKYDIQKHLRD